MGITQLTMEQQTRSDNLAPSSQPSSPRLSRASSLRRLLPHVRRRSAVAAPTSHPHSSSTSPSSPLQTVTPPAPWPRLGSTRSERPRSVLVDNFTLANRLAPTWEEGSVLHGVKKMRAPNLGISVHREASDRENSNNANAREVAGASPLSSPRTPHTPGPHSPFAQTFADGYDTHSQSPAAAIGRHPSPKPLSKSVKSMFSNPMASRSTTKLNTPESPVRQPVQSTSQQGSMAQVYNMKRAVGSSPELTVTNVNSTESSTLAPSEDAHNQNTDSLMSLPNHSKKKSSKHKFLGIGRKSSVREDGPRQHYDGRAAASQRAKSKLQRDVRQDRGLAPQHPTYRAQSTDRQGSEDSSLYPTSNGPHGSLQHNIRSTGTRAADGFGRAAKGLLGKLSTRSNNAMDSRETQEKAARTARDEAEAQRAFLSKNYKVVNLPLDEQTRRTRICRRLEDCKDKTEFWLPAVAYRCIDYLNDKGMAHEGLYRVPGSEREIRNWIWRFDNEHDIDLLNEEELYDVNTISSMFKAWLRDLPDEVFPKTLQHKIAATVPKLTEQQGAPELLKAELSQLPPFNYYLLFAVTAHITMLLNASKENKMTFHNLCVCFMPAMKMDLPCFQWLILDWKNCWRGCSTERDYLEREYDLIEQQEDQGVTADQRERVQQHFDRYPPPTSKHGESLNGSSKESSKYFPSRDVSVERGRAAKKDQSSHASSRSPAARPATSPVAAESSIKFPTESSSSRRDKNRPAPLESTVISHSRHGSEPPSTYAAGKTKNSSGQADKTNGKDGRAESNLEQIKDQPSTPPEIDPVKPLSPFGSLDENLKD